MLVITRLDRYELKYVVPLATGDAIAEELATRTVPDEHSGATGYRVVSLYYDSPGLDLYWANVDRLEFRRKLRLRLYVDGDIERTDKGMVEIKQRVNRAVQKRRIALPLAQAERLCAGQLEPTEVDERDRSIAIEVRDFVRAMQLQPTAITDYQRRAFVEAEDGAGLRITIDTAVRGRCHALDVSRAEDNHSILRPDLCVVEIKVNGAVPHWVSALLSRHACPPQRMSKYCTVVSRLADAPQAALQASGD